MVPAGPGYEGQQVGRLTSAGWFVHRLCHMQHILLVGTSVECGILRAQAQALAIEGYRSGKRAGATGKASLGSLKELVRKG